MSNITQIMGHLGQDPEVRFTPGGQKVTTLRVATNSKRAGKEETSWWNVTVWDERCNLEKMLPYLKKGSAVIVVGEMGARLYDDKEGNKRISLDLTADLVRFSPYGRSESSKQESTQNSNYGQQESSYGNKSYGEPSFASQSNGSYGSNSLYGQNNSANMSQMSDDDSIPF